MDALFVYLPLTNTSGQTFNYWVNLMTVERISDANAPSYGISFNSGASYTVNMPAAEFEKLFNLKK